MSTIWVSVHSAKATFFMVGQWVEEWPDLARAVLGAGHQIGNHTYSHEQIARLSRDQLLYEIARTDEAIQKACGNKPTCFRPPYFDTVSSQIAQLLARNGHVVVGWSLDSRDWTKTSPEAIAAGVLAKVKPGEIVLMHDGGGPRPRSVKALDIILTELERRGYLCVTVDRLFSCQ